MEYNVSALAKLSGVSARTLRYYDAVGLLRPARTAENGYRVYGTAEVDRLQQILFYRELGLKLDEIGRILSSPDFDRRAAMRNHLQSLLRDKTRLERLIATVSKTLAALEGETDMTDMEKFEGFKRDKLAENEAKYGAEIRRKYGEKTVEKVNEKFSAMTPKGMAKAEELENRFNEALKEAAASGDMESEAARRACEAHRDWLLCFWTEDMYSPQAHLALAEMYLADERFKAHYDAVAPDGTELFSKMLRAYYA